MVRKSRSMQLSALAVATAIVIAPAAWSGGKVSGFQRPAQAAVASKPGQAQHDRFIITYRSGAKRMTSAATAQSLSAAARASGIGIQPMRTLATGSALIRTDRKLDRAASKRLMLALMKDPNVLAVEPDRRVQRLFVPNDPGYADQWHYKDGPGGINMEPAWDLSTGEGVVVGVIDTGITPHSDLDANIVGGYDFIFDPDVSVDGDGRDADPNDPGDWHSGECNIFGIPEDSSWHGTHVAGTVAAVTDNNNGVAGVAHGAKVQPLRGLGKCGGYTSDIVDAITWASGGAVAGVPDNATPAEVINLSLGGGGACSVAEQTAIDAAVARGSTIVVAAGNSSSDVSGFSPASCDNVIAVSSVGPTGALSGFSNFGALIDVAAPGGSGAAPAEDNILSTLNSGTQGQAAEAYAWYAGTSMSAPHVAGVVALMQSAAVAAGGSPKTPAEIEEILVNTSYSGTFPAGCSYSKWCGSGVIDARYAVAVASGAEPLPEPPPPPPPPPPAIELENGVTVTGIEVLAGEGIRYELEVPNGASNLLFAMFGGTGDADMYVRYGAEPTDTAFDCRPFSFGNDETCFFPAPQGGTWYVTVKGFSDASGVSLYPSFVDANWPRGLEADAEPLGNNRTEVNLTWEAGDQRVDIYRNDAILKTVRNRGNARDVFRIIGSGVMSYKICNNGTLECSSPVEIEYESTGRARRTR